MNATKLYRQRLRDLIAFGAILTAMGVVALATNQIHAAPKDGQIVRKELKQPEDGHSFTPVPPASRRTVINGSEWPDPKPIYLTKNKPVVF